MTKPDDDLAAKIGAAVYAILPLHPTALEIGRAALGAVALDFINREIWHDQTAQESERLRARIAEVQEIVAAVLLEDGDRISTHYESCYLRHAPCLAVLIRDTLKS